MHDCQHEKCEPRRHIKSNGITVVRLQCLTCGRSLRELPKAEHAVDLLPVFDLSIQERIEAIQNQEWQVQQELNAAKKSEWFLNYNEYLQHPHWRRIREVVILRDHVCQVCFGRRATQAHHLTYDSYNKWGVSFATECAGICDHCHGVLHKQGCAL